MDFTTFQSCMYGSTRPKRTMLGHNAEEFAVINKMCCGISASHKHDKWGIDVESRKFATALETACPIQLARAIAAQFVVALQNRGIRMPQETMDAVGVFHNATLSALRAQSGLQPKASRLPPLIPTFAAKVALSGFQSDLPQFQLQWKLQAQLQVQAINAPTLLPKASKLLQVMPFLLPPSCLERGVFVSEQQICEDDLNRIVSMCQEPQVTRQGTCETQLWGVPWSEDQFIEQMVKFGHPTTVKWGLPEVLQSTIEFLQRNKFAGAFTIQSLQVGFLVVAPCGSQRVWEWVEVIHGYRSGSDPQGEKSPVVGGDAQSCWLPWHGCHWWVAWRHRSGWCSGKNRLVAYQISASTCDSWWVARYSSAWACRLATAVWCQFSRSWVHCPCLGQDNGWGELWLAWGPDWLKGHPLGLSAEPQVWNTARSQGEVHWWFFQVISEQLRSDLRESKASHDRCFCSNVRTLDVSCFEWWTLGWQDFWFSWGLQAVRCETNIKAICPHHSSKTKYPWVGWVQDEGPAFWVGAFSARVSSYLPQFVVGLGQRVQDLADQLLRWFCCCIPNFWK